MLALSGCSTSYEQASKPVLFTPSALEYAQPLPSLNETSANGMEGDDQPSTIGIRELIAEESQVIRMYHDLAAKHNRLVDEVRNFLTGTSDGKE